MKINKILLGHGSGGKLTYELIKNLFSKYIKSPYHNFQDAAILPILKNKIAFTTDSFTVKPLFFKGGSIGTLAVNGTVNDILVSGAIPKYLSLSFILEEGFDIETLEKILKDISKATKEAKVDIVCGDTKVVEKSKVDKVFINTSGIGEVVKELGPHLVEEGDDIILSGFAGDHGAIIFLERENFPIEVDFESDCSPLTDLILPLFNVKGVKWMRDPTRGGVATTLIELALDIENKGLGIELYEDNIPVRESVKLICDMLGFDPLYLANEGKVLIVCSPKDTQKVLETLHKNEKGKDAKVIGKIVKGKGVSLITSIGGKRILDMLEDDPLPRIC